MSGIRSISYIRYVSGRLKHVQGWVVEEIPLCLRVNGQPWITLMCSPHDLEDLVLGYLRSEGVISSTNDVLEMQWDTSSSCVNVRVASSTPLPEHPTRTTGCEGGVTFADLAETLPPIRSSWTISPEHIIRQMQDLLRSAPLYRQARGIHSAGLSDGHRLLLHVEDVGRHNALDRLWGRAMREGIEMGEHFILTTGRISAEMLRKVTLMRIPLIASRTSPTALSLELAQAWGVTIIGYVRSYSLRVYTHPERVRE